MINKNYNFNTFYCPKCKKTLNINKVRMKVLIISKKPYKAINVCNNCYNNEKSDKNG